MKKIATLLCAAALYSTANAQVPVNRTMAMVQKSTATWCPQCGGWGWTLQDQVIADNMVGSNPNAIVLEAHGALSALHTSTSADMLAGWMGNTVPRWAVNNFERMADRTTIKRAVDSFVAKSPTASTGFYYTLNGNTIKMYTTTRFWKAANGIYTVGTYIIEDSAFTEQIGQPNDKAYHRFVLRAQFTKSVFGDTIVKSSVAADQSFSRNYTFTITRTDWVKNRLKFMTVIWKRNGNDWEVVNVNTMKSAPTGVNAEAAAVDQLIVYPNPATEQVRLSGVLNVNGDAQIMVANAVGQTVFQRGVAYNGGQLGETIDTRNWPAGVYMLVISSEGARTSQRLVVSH